MEEVPSNEEIQKYISDIYNQLEVALGVLFEWNRTILIKNPPHIKRSTKGILFYISDSQLVALMEAIQSIAFMNQNLDCVTKLFHFLYDNKNKNVDFNSLFDFSSMCKIDICIISNRLPLL